MIGKGIFVWKEAYINPSGGFQGVVDQCIDLGLDWVAIKIGNGSSTAYASFADMPGAVKRLHEAGIKVWGWHYVTGGNGYSSIGPMNDAVFAYDQCTRLELDGYLIDAESEYKTGSDPKGRAQVYADALQGLGARMPIGLCSYRFPTLHPEFPWVEMLSVCTLHVPQLYWGPGRWLTDLNRSYSELEALKNLPFVPDGRNYVGDGYAGPTPGNETLWIQQFVAEINGFMQACKDRKYPGFTSWALDFMFLSTHAGGEERYAAVKSFEWWREVEAEPFPDVDHALATLAVRQKAMYDDLVRNFPDLTWTNIAQVFR